MGFYYRARQFWFALTAAPSAKDLGRAKEVLSPALMGLFLRMQPAEQVHSLKIFHRLIDAGEKSPELLAAALLHDVGKCRYPLRAWERALAVVGRALVPDQAERWSRCEPSGWKRAFVVAVHHPDWGAELVEKAGGHPLTVGLIRRHQERIDGQFTREDRLLVRLQELDNES